MCDYSLEQVASRPAEAGETLVLAGLSPIFSSRGFKSVKDDSTTPTAVCLKCNTLLHLDFPDGKCDSAIFTSKDPSERWYRDGVVLSNGTVVSLQALPVGTRATVLVLADRAMPEDAELVPPPAHPYGESPLATVLAAE